MTNRFFDRLNWRKSVGFRMSGSIVLSFTLTVLSSFIWNNGLNSIPVIGALMPFILFLSVFFLFFYLFMRPVINRLRTISEGLMAIARGDLDYRVLVTSDDELGAISRNINYMAEQLQERIHKERLTEASKMELITHVSHDLRTPLTSIVGYLNLLKNDDYRDLAEHKRYINNAFNKTEQLRRLIDDLFHYTRLSGGTTQLSCQAIDLSGLVAQIIHEFEPLAQRNSLTVTTHLQQTPLFESIDAEKFVRAVDNLLMNALKFSLKPGSITVRLGEREQHIRLEVENHGKPITEDQQQLLFERFYKADASRYAQDMPQGSGLGLSIARNIIELHGGRLDLVHDNGYFTFIISLPRNRELPSPEHTSSGRGT